MWRLSQQGVRVKFDSAYTNPVGATAIWWLAMLWQLGGWGCYGNGAAGDVTAMGQTAMSQQVGG